LFGAHWTCQKRILGATAFLIATVLGTLRKQNHIPLLRANTTDLFKVVSLKKKNRSYTALVSDTDVGSHPS
jgi:hypothetical protein